jgi:hypothetical protein
MWEAIAKAPTSLLGSFTPAQSITSALALAAIIVSVVGLVQRQRQNPRVDLQLDWRPWKIHGDKFPQLGVGVFIANDGLAPARRVRIWAGGIGTAHGEPHVRFDEIAPGEEVYAVIPYEEGERPRLRIRFSHRRRVLWKRGPRKIWDEGP